MGPLQACPTHATNLSAYSKVEAEVGVCRQSLTALRVQMKRTMSVKSAQHTVGLLSPQESLPSEGQAVTRGRHLTATSGTASCDATPSPLRNRTIYGYNGRFFESLDDGTCTCACVCMTAARGVRRKTQVSFSRFRLLVDVVFHVDVILF